MDIVKIAFTKKQTGRYYIDESRAGLWRYRGSIFIHVIQLFVTWVIFDFLRPARSLSSFLLLGLQVGLCCLTTLGSYCQG